MLTRINIDPRSPTEDQKDKLNQLLKENETEAVVTGSDKVEFPHGVKLVKFNEGYYVTDAILGAGSAESKVQNLSHCYKKNASGEYEIQSESLNAVVKITNLNQVQKSNVAQAYYYATGNKLEKEKIVTEFREMLENECKMLSLSGDANAEIIIPKTQGGMFYLKMTKASGISLDKYLSKNEHLTFEQRLHLIDLIATAVNDLHQKGVCHLDLKPENIMYDETKDEIKFIDFGSAQAINADLSKISANRHRTTKEFDPPDHNKNTPAQIDNYSLAGIIGEVLGNRGYKFDDLEKAPYLASDEERKKMGVIIKTLKELGHPDYEQRGKSYNDIYEKNEQKNKQRADRLNSIEGEIIRSALGMTDKKERELEHDKEIYSSSLERVRRCDHNEELIECHNRYGMVTDAILERDVDKLLMLSQQQLEEDQNTLISGVQSSLKEKGKIELGINHSQTRIDAIQHPELHKNEMKDLFSSDEIKKLKNDTNKNELLNKEMAKLPELKRKQWEYASKIGFVNELGKKVANALKIIKTVKEKEYHPQKKVQSSSAFVQGSIKNQERKKMFLDRGAIVTAPTMTMETNVKKEPEKENLVEAKPKEPVWKRGEKEKLVGAKSKEPVWKKSEMPKVLSGKEEILDADEKEKQTIKNIVNISPIVSSNVLNNNAQSESVILKKPGTRK